MKERIPCLMFFLHWTPGIFLIFANELLTLKIIFLVKSEILIRDFFEKDSIFIYQGKQKGIFKRVCFECCYFLIQ